MLTHLKNILTFQRYEKWKVEEKLGSKAHLCYIRIRVITNRVISRFKCYKLFVAQYIQGVHGQGKSQGKKYFFKVRELSGNFQICQGILEFEQKSGKSQGILK